jgi:tetratricopeptide (TPR) repeat protein
MGDHEREEKFYLEAGSISSWTAPWFNLALMQKRLGRIEEAIESIERGMRTDRQAPYLVLRAMLAERANRQHERDALLEEALRVFDPISAQSDWELGWYLTALRMRGDEEKAAEVQAEQRRRARGGVDTQPNAGFLPITTEGLQRVDI